MGDPTRSDTGSAEQVTLIVQRHQLQVFLGGQWSIHEPLQQRSAVESVLEKHPNIREILVDGAALGEWDSALVAYLRQLSLVASDRQLELQEQSLPEGVLRILALTKSVNKIKPPASPYVAKEFAERLGLGVVRILGEFMRFVEFLGESILALQRFFRGKAVFRGEDLKIFLQDSGPASLGIVTLISVLIGMILAFVGAVQLQKFGASIYVANLVGLSMAREMAAMMTAIIMAGRTGAAFAAQLGSMQVNEEVDALKTMGISPMEYLVVPRLVALVIMMPLLTIYANLMGILGGGLVSVTMLDLSWSVYMQQISQSVPLIHFGIGLFKSLLFGILVALSGCYMGMNSGRSATAVGKATTSAVVMGIVLIIVFDSLVTIITTVLNI